jgi:hypothetical protein
MMATARPAPLIFSLLIFSIFACLNGASSAWGTFPGTNGGIVYVMEGPHPGERVIESAFLGGQGRLVPDQAKLWTTEVNRGGAFDPAWSEDGRNLTFTSTRSGRRQIYAIALDANRGLSSLCQSSVCPLTSGPAENYESSWSVDGRAVVFTSDREGSPQIYRMSWPGGVATRLTFDGSTDREATWSSTGKIAFVSDLTGAPEIYVMNGWGGELRQLTKTGVNTAPSWAPDGEALSYTAATPEGLQIFTVTLTGETPRRLTGPPMEARSSSWSPDGTKLLVDLGPGRSGHAQMEVIAASSGKVLSRPYIGAGEDSDWAPLPAAPPDKKPSATAGVTVVVRPLGGETTVSPGHPRMTAPSTEQSAAGSEQLASKLTKSVEAPVNSTYDLTQRGAVKLTVATEAPTQSRTGTPTESTAIIKGGHFILAQQSPTGAPLIRLVGRPHGCGRALTARAGRRGYAHVGRRGRVQSIRGYTKGRWKMAGHEGKASSLGTYWEIRNTCRGTLYIALQHALLVTDPHRKHPIRITAGHRYLVRPGHR